MSIRFVFILLCAVLISCNEEISVGSSIVDDGSITLDYTDTLFLSGKTVKGDPAVVFRNTSTFDRQTYLLGQLDDPSFGSSRADLYMSSNVVDNFFPAFDTLKIDSVVMVLPLDTLGQFGEDNVLHDIRVYQLSNTLEVDFQDTLFSDQSFDFNPVAIGEYTGIVNHLDSVDVYSVTEDRIIAEEAQLRITLDTALWHEIASDTLVSRNDTLYNDVVKGFLVQASSSESSMIGINLAPNSNVGIRFYYSADDTTHRVYTFDLANIRSNNFIHDYSGTAVESALNSGDDELMYLQGMEGLDLELDLSSVRDVSDRIINRAVLELILDESDNTNEAVEQLEAFYFTTAGTRIRLTDQILQNNSFISVFGGRLSDISIDGLELKAYNIDISNHVNAIIENDIDTATIRLQAINKEQSGLRSAIFGPAHNTYPAKIKLVTSKP
jgi:hypothetical protein